MLCICPDGSRRGLGTPHSMYLSSKAIHTFWRPSAGPADLQEVIHVGLCASQVTLAATNLLNTNARAVIETTRQVLLKRRINHLHENIVAEHTTPHIIQIRQRLARHGFLGRLPGVLQFLHPIARDNQHVPALRQIGQRKQRCEACSYDLRGAKRRHVRGPDSREGSFTLVAPGVGASTRNRWTG
jgi:hypothetical protein